MLPLLALGALLEGARLPTVDYTCAPTRLANLLPALEEKAGKPLTCSGVLRDQVLSIRAEAMPLKELMNAIAWATRAKWVSEKSGFMLIREEPERRQMEEDSRSYVAGLVALFQANMREDLDKGREYSAGELVAAIGRHNLDSSSTPDGRAKKNRRAAELLAAMPAERALNQVVCELDPKVLATLPLGHTAFATHPTTMQARLSGEAGAALDRAVQSQNAFLSAISDAPLLDDLWEEGDIPLHQEAERARRAVLVVNRSHTQPLFTFTLYLLGPSGELMREASCSGVREPASGLAASGKEPPVPFSADTMAFHAAALQATRTEDFEVEALKPKLLQPEMFDPLGFTLADGLVGLAHKTSRQLVACVDEGLFSRMHLVPPSVEAGANMTPSVLRREFEGLGYEWKDEGGMISIRKRDAAASLQVKMDRMASGKIIRRFNAAGYVTFDELADFANAAGRAGANWEIRAITLLRPNERPLFPRFKEGLIEVYGSLSPLQRAAFWSTEGLPLAALTSAQRKLLHEKVMRQARTGAVTVEGIGFAIQSEVLPNGLTQGVLQGSFTRQHVALPHPNLKHGYVILNPLPMARQIHDEGIEKLPEIYVPATSFNCTLQLLVRGGYLADTARSYELPSGAQPVPLRALPAPFLEELDRELRRLAGGG
ncbi:MAG TPA: hypothetical protein VM328_01800 [Fimbriimonadaceae bacterium]|nr:hypothetical protein [Fimbriimonadaceae bacterium]